MGWVPQQAQLGDLLCICKGTGVPFLLRRAFSSVEIYLSYSALEQSISRSSVNVISIVSWKVSV
jgi:hypothetical protein